VVGALGLNGFRAGLTKSATSDRRDGFRLETTVKAISPAGNRIVYQSELFQADYPN
jgi:hypothetical protein